MRKPCTYDVRPRLGHFEIVNNTTGVVLAVREDEMAAQAIAGSYSQVVGQVHGVDVTRGELAEAFELVKPCDHWKNPICGTVCDYQLAALPGATSAEDGFERVREAVRFFTGSLLTKVSSPASGVWNVEADGYFAAVGS